MFSKSFIVAGFVALLAAAAPVNGARVRFYTTRDSCKGSPSQDYQNVKCNSCIDPPGDWFAAQVSDIGNQRWTMHNQNSCTSKSQVAQVYGNGCAIAGATAVRSVWVAC